MTIHGGAPETKEYGERPAYSVYTPLFPSGFPLVQKRFRFLNALPPLAFGILALLFLMMACLLPTDLGVCPLFAFCSDSVAVPPHLFVLVLSHPPSVPSVALESGLPERRVFPASILP